MKRYIIIFSCLLSFALNISADDTDSIKTQADSAYSREQYDKAIMLYEKIAKKTSDYKVFYNLGCSYYRIDNIENVQQGLIQVMKTFNLIFL